MKRIFLSLAVAAMTLAATAGAPAFVHFDGQSTMEANAQAWFETNVTDGQVIAPADLAELNVLTTPAVWVMIDRDGLAVGEANLPVSADFKTALEAYAKRGGNILLTGHAAQLVKSIGRCPYAPGIFGSGNGGENPDVWGLQAVIGDVEGQIYDHRDHAIYKDLVDNNKCGHPTFALVASGFKKDHNCMWDLNAGEYALEANPNKVKDFENKTTSVVLGTWQHVTDYCCAGIVEFLPSGDFSGTILAVGLAAFDWYAKQEGTNMSVMTANMLNYMTETTPTGLNNVIENNATKIVENGQLIIIMDGVRYNVLGTVL